MASVSTGETMEVIDQLLLEFDESVRAAVSAAGPLSGGALLKQLQSTIESISGVVNAWKKAQPRIIRSEEANLLG